MNRQQLLDSLSSPPWEVIGHSGEDRPIVARGFPGGEPPILLFGAIHGDEPLGAFLLAELAGELAAAGPLPRETWLLPCLNPDGFLVGQKGNARGVDLNRNFPAANWQREHAPRYFPGEEPGSERETQALLGLIERLAPTRFISLHSPFRTVNYDGPAQALAERMAAKNGYGATADIGYPTPGSFGSLYGVECQLEVITLEIPRMTPAEAWAENRLVLYEALERPPAV